MYEMTSFQNEEKLEWERKIYIEKRAGKKFKDI